MIIRRCDFCDEVIQEGDEMQTGAGLILVQQGTFGMRVELDEGEGRKWVVAIGPIVQNGTANKFDLHQRCVLKIIKRGQIQKS